MIRIRLISSSAGAVEIYKKEQKWLVNWMTLKLSHATHLRQMENFKEFLIRSNWPLVLYVYRRHGVTFLIKQKI